MLSCARGFGDVVARGYHLRVRLRRKSWEFGAPTGWKLTPQPQKNRDDDDISITLTRCVLHKARCCPQRRQDSPPFPRPLPTRPVPTIASAGCISRFRLHALSPKNRQFFARTLIPNRDSHFPSWKQRALWRGHRTSHDWRVPCSPLSAVASPRREEAVDLGALISDKINKSTHGHNAPASTASSNDPITPALACGHLLIDDQHPKRAHRCGGGCCCRTT